MNFRSFYLFFPARVSDLKARIFGKWSWDKKGMFSVKKMASIIQGKLSQGVAAGAHSHWNSLVPSKVNIFVWHLLNGGLPTRHNLAKTRLYLASNLCVMCNG